MTDADELDLEQLARGATDEFERRVLEIGPYGDSAQDPATWQDAIVFVQAGAIEIVCARGGHERFRRGDILCLAPLSVHSVRNPSAEPARLLVISRRTSSL
jgi:glyoxylate utilization-related uncharacterized protein